MEKLLSTYSLTDILLFLIIFAIAAKGVITFFDWAADRLRKVFSKEFNQTTAKQDLELRLQEHSQTMDELKNNQKELHEAVMYLTKKVDMLIDSDKDDIKSFLTKEHHYFCYQQGWIDDYSLECCERRYAHYVDEGGNSFIAGFMDELRQLPKCPPHST